jgi:hypothetical protein
MNELEIKKLNQLILRTDMSGNKKVEWLVDFIEKREQSKEMELEVWCAFDDVQLTEELNQIGSDL